jgi:hypothetical protein
MKRVALKLAIAVLLITELYICTGFLPNRWQVAIDHTLSQLLPERKPDQWDITHPALNEEIEQVMQEHPRLKLIVVAFIAFILALNTMLLLWAWKALRRKPSEPLPQGTGTHP